MDLETFHWLLTPDGQALLAEAGELDLSPPAQLATLSMLRRRSDPARAAAAYETAVLRGRAAAKFPRAELMYFTREALEQASGAAVASYRVSRYRSLSGSEHSGGAVADLCCGVGGDTLAFAGAGLPVTGVDRDPLRLALAEANALALGLAERVRFVQADLEREAPPPAGAIFFDPARRSGGRRVFTLAEYAPPVALVERWRAGTPAIGVKVAPGVSDDELAALRVPEVEFISLDGELKEAVLWFGPLASEGRRATVLLSARAGGARGEGVEGNRSSAAASARTMIGGAGDDEPRPEVAEPRAYLYEPDPAVIRAHLVAQLAAELGAAQLDREIAYLTADAAVATPFARCWRVIEWLPFALKRLRVRLREHGAGPVTVKKRGSPLDPDVLARSLSGDGARPLVVVLTQVRGRHAALICDGPI
jgi:hypothetical protein